MKFCSLRIYIQKKWMIGFFNELYLKSSFLLNNPTIWTFVNDTIPLKYYTSFLEGFMTFNERRNHFFPPI